MNRLVAALIVWVLTVPCAARTISVDADGSADYPTIQRAIDASRDGDVIVVRPGTYRERIAFVGKRITVRSEDPDDPAVVGATVIVGPSASSDLFDSEETGQCVL